MVEKDLPLQTSAAYVATRAYTPRMATRRGGLWLAAFAVLLALVATHVRAIAAVTGGAFLYPMDDLYIELAMARSLAEHGVWGVTPVAFTGVGTSLIWPWTLAVAHRAFSSEWWPLGLNLASAAALLVVATRYLSAHVNGVWLRAWILAVLVVASPLAALSVLGMEHTLQALAALALAMVVARALASEAPVTASTLVVSGVLAMLATATRYDTATVVGAAVMCAAWRRQWRLVVTLTVCAAVPPLLYAIVASGHGWPWVPVTILVKHRALGGILDVLGLGPLQLLWRAGYIWPLWAASIALIWQHWRTRDVRRRESTWLLCIFVIATFVHFDFSDGGNYVNRRYDAYLVCLGIVGVGAAVGRSAEEWGRRGLRIAVVAVAALAIVYTAVGMRRSVKTFTLQVEDGRLEFLTTHQLARLLLTPGLPAVPAVQDLGEPSYMLRAPVFDLDGLGTLEVGRAWRDRTWDEDTFRRLARQYGTRTAAVLTHTVPMTHVPLEWISLGEWRVDDAFSYAFFAADTEAAERFAASIAAFDAQLPQGVRRYDASGARVH